MAQPFLGEVRIFGFQFAPKGWAVCNGQTLAISQNSALFSILGTMYGGNGVNTFQLPNLQGCVPLHMGDDFVIGQVGGEENHTLVLNEIPLHSHFVNAATAAGNSDTPVGNILAQSTNFNLYASSGAGPTLQPGTIGDTGGGQPHPNMQPYLVVNFCIALTGIFPSRN